jgi:hypothetical protein
MPTSRNRMVCPSPGSVSRREFVSVGTLGALLSLPNLLGAGSAGRPGRTERSCIFIVQQGGLSHIDSWDMKPAAAEEFRGPLKSIATPIPGFRVCELMPGLARLADRYCVLRSLTHQSADHGAGMDVCLSGQTRPPADAPAFGSIMSKTRPATTKVPSYVWIQDMEGDAGQRHHSGGLLGAAHAPLRVGKGTDNFANPAFEVTAFDPARGMTAGRLGQRRRLLEALEPDATDALRRHRERAFDLVTGSEAKRAFDVRAEPAKLRERYGRHPVGQNLLAARRLIEAGVRLVSVHAFTGFDGYTKWPPVVNVWDMHAAGGKSTSIFGMNTYGLPFALPRLDQAVSALLEDLELRGLLETTLVVLVGEFGRTPKINANTGRDHWPACYSGMLAGAGIRGGAVYGSSDKIAAHVKDSPVSPEDFGATILHALGVAPETRLSPDGFTRPASEGRPIQALFG